MGSHNARNTNVMNLWLFSFIFEHTIIFAGFVLLERCLPAIYCTTYYGLKRMKEEQGLLIQSKNTWMQQGLNLWLEGERPAPKPLNHEDLLIFWGHHSSIWLNLHRPSFYWTCITPYVPSRHLKSMQAIFMNLRTPSSRFFLQQWPQKGAFSLTGCKMWSANP